MHELGVTESLLDIALTKAQEAEANRIIKITVTLGELSGFVPECIEFYFESLSKDTIAENADLEFNLIKAQFRCRSCAKLSSSEDIVWTCPYCHSHNLEVVGGREFFVKDLEVE
jgi:hydrogenase nickel incorporation protein HypA/HybF